MARGKCSQPSGPANQRPTKHASPASRGSGVTDHPNRVVRKTRTCLIGSVRVRVEKGEGEGRSVVLSEMTLFLGFRSLDRSGSEFWYRH